MRDRRQPPLRIIRVGDRFQARHLFLNHPPLGIQRHRARSSCRRCGRDRLGRLIEHTRVRATVDDERIGLRRQAQRIERIRQRGGARGGQRGGQGARQLHRQTLRDRYLHAEPRVRPLNRGRDRPVRGRESGRAIKLDERRCRQPARIGVRALLVARRRGGHLVGRAPVQRRAHRCRPAGALVRARERLEPGRRILVLDESPLGVIRELVHAVARIGECRQEAVGGVGHLRRLASGIPMDTR